MIQFIKNKIYESALHKPINTTKSALHEVAVFMHKPHDEAEYKMIAKTLGIEEDKIHFLIFIPSNEVISYPKSHYTQKHIGWAEFPKNEAVDSFLSQKYKQFYFLCPAFEKHHSYVVKRAVADFKTGVTHLGNEGFFDLAIDTTFTSASSSIKEIKELITKLSNSKK
jgi:hypothetical protein